MNNVSSTSGAEFFEINDNSRKYKRKIRYPYKLYLPENLDIDVLLAQKPPAFKYHRDYFVYILHLINSIPSHQKDFDLEKQMGFTPVNKNFLSRRLHNYKAYIDYLKENKVIIEGTSYLPNFYSRGLKFSREYQTKITSCYITKNTLIKSITERNDSKDIEAENKLIFLKTWFNPNLIIDRKEAISFLESDRKKTILKIGLQREGERKKKYATSIEEVATFGYNQKLITVDKIFDGKNYRLSIDKTSGRFHSPLTNLKKELRKYIKYSKEKLVSIDIVNSQPLLAIVVLDINLFLKNNIDEILMVYNNNFKDLKNVINNYNTVKSINNNKSSSTMLVNLLIKYSNAKDVEEFKKTVIDGRFYELFANNLKEKSLLPNDIIDNPILVRKFAKTAVLTAFFSQNSSIKWNKYMQAFRECFPNVYKIFSLIKLGNNNALACLLQRFESDLVLHNVCFEINKVNPNIPIFTIHDSIVTTEKYANIVKEIFGKNISDKLGVKPKLLTEKW